VAVSRVRVSRLRSPLRQVNARMIPQMRVAKTPCRFVELAEEHRT
jgi:hypothetical protein